MFASHDSTRWVSNPMNLLSKVCLMTISAFHDRRSDHLWRHTIQSCRLASVHRISRLQMMCQRGPVAQWVCRCSRSRFQPAQQHLRLLQNAFRLALSLAHRLGSSIHCSWLAAKQTPSQDSISVKCFFCPVVFSFCCVTLAICFLQRFRNSDSALFVFRDSHHISFIACVRLRSVLLIFVFACSLHFFHVESLAPCSRSDCPSLPGCRSTAASICISIFVTTAVLKASSFFTIGFRLSYHRQNFSFLGREVPQDNASSRPAIWDRTSSSTSHLFSCSLFSSLPAICPTESE